MTTTDLIIFIYIIVIFTILGFILFTNLFRIDKYTTNPIINLIRPFVLKINQKKYLFIAQIPLVLGLGFYLGYLTINGEIEYKNNLTKEAYIKEELRNIRDLQVLYKSQSGDNKYCDNFNDLINFAKNDSVEITKKVERFRIIVNPDWIANGWKTSDIEKEPKYYKTPSGEQKVNEEGGWLKQTWTEKVLINKKKVCCSENDSIQISNLENIQNDLPTRSNLSENMLKNMVIDNLEKVVGEDSNYSINTGWIEKTKTGTFEVSYLNKETGQVLSIGDLQTGSTDGNWE